MGTVLDAIQAHRSAFAAYSVAIRAIPQEEATIGAAGDAERAAIVALFSAPATSFADVSAKATYLLGEIHEVGDYFAEDELVASFLRSLQGPAIVAPDAPDLFLSALRQYQAEIKAHDPDAPDATATLSASIDRLFREPGEKPPAITSTAGALAAIDEIHSERELEPNGISDTLLVAVRSFIEQDEPAHAQPDDPLLALIAEYRRQAAIWTADTTSRSDAEEDAFYAATARPSFEKLRDDCPPATPLAGALAAFRLVADEDARLANWNAASSVLAAGNAYFSKEASR